MAEVNTNETQSITPSEMLDGVRIQLQNTIRLLHAEKARLDVELSQLQTSLEQHRAQAVRTEQDYDSQIRSKTFQIGAIERNIEGIQQQINR